jgi:Ca-activated chloride channel family protein
MLENLHFIQPLWLLALIPLLLLAWRMVRPSGGDNPWTRIVDARLLPLLMVGGAHKLNRIAPWLAAAGWIIAALALANPTWERKPQPVYQTMAARVVVLDLSRSMEATDLKPSRLVRARYKVEDVLALGAEGQTGLVVYAGDAFTVSPLTRDVNTIRALLKVLEPGIMPAPGSRADLGLLKAGELMRQAGVSNGQVLLITDGVEPDQAAVSERAAARLRSDGYRVSVLGVGIEDGAPLANAQGRPMRDAAGNLGNPQLDTATPRSLARAGGGEYRSITDNDQAMSTLLPDRQPLRAEATARTDASTQGWKEQGPLLAVLLLPLAALAFRRNWLVGLVLVAGLASPPQPAMASTWDDLWQKPEQQAAKALAAGDYAKAAALAADAGRRGSAEYKRGNYQRALENFAHETGADADYNRGNALAKLGRYQDAIAAYDKSLEQNPGGEDARVNKAAVEALLKQQQAKQQSSDSQSQGGKSQKDQGQSSGAGQNSPQNKAQSQSSKDGKSGQGGASSAPGQQAANANKSEAGSQGGEPSGGHAKDHPGQDASSSKGSDGKQPGKDNQGKGATSGKESGQPTPATPGTAQQQPGNQFAEAAKKLAEPRTGAKADESQASNQAPGGNAADQAQAAANAKQHPRGRSADGAQPLDSEERMAAEQWLRRIPDDPGGLLRRKFLYQYRQRAQHPASDI